MHCWYIEPQNREKSLTLIWQRFSCLLDEWIAKISKKKKISWWLFEIIHIICFEIWDLEIWNFFLGYDINYLSIWPFMGHPWFPTRKASKLSFTCFQHQVLNTLQGTLCRSEKIYKYSLALLLLNKKVGKLLTNMRLTQKI